MGAFWRWRLLNGLKRKGCCDCSHLAASSRRSDWKNCRSAPRILQWQGRSASAIPLRTVVIGTLIFAFCMDVNFAKGWQKVEPNFQDDMKALVA
jgi:hypothetical protein